MDEAAINLETKNRVENNVKIIGGVTGKGFRKGQTGNPGGRPKGIAAFVREQTNDGKELVEFSLKILRGELTITRYTTEGAAYEQTPSINDRQVARDWLAERGFGKVPQGVDLGNSTGIIFVPLVVTPTEVIGSNN